MFIHKRIYIKGNCNRIPKWQYKKNIQKPKVSRTNITSKSPIKERGHDKIAQQCLYCAYINECTYKEVDQNVNDQQKSSKNDHPRSTQGSKHDSSLTARQGGADPRERPRAGRRRTTLTSPSTPGKAPDPRGDDVSDAGADSRWKKDEDWGGAGHGAHPTPPVVRRSAVLRRTG